MRTIKTFAVVLAMTCVGTSGLAQPYTGAGKKVPADQWMPQAARPYSNQEIEEGLKQHCPSLII